LGEHRLTGNPGLGRPQIDMGNVGLRCCLAASTAAAVSGSRGKGICIRQASHGRTSLLEPDDVACEHALKSVPTTLQNRDSLRRDYLTDKNSGHQKDFSLNMRLSLGKAGSLAIPPI